MATRATQQISIDGIAETFHAAAAGDKINPGPTTFLHVKNVNAATRTLTLATPGTVGGNAIADRAVIIPANTGDLLIGPITREIYMDTDGLVAMSWSATSDVTFSVVSV